MTFTPLAIALLSSSLCYATERNDFAGKWSNADANSSGITRIQISKSGKTWTIHAWAIGDGGELDQGETALSLLGDSVFCPLCVEPPKPTIAGLREGVPMKTPNAVSRLPVMKYGFAHWDYKFKDTYLTVIREKDNLIVEDFNIFKDESQRTNYRLRYLFQKADGRSKEASR
jgi:hypothetical protein